MLIDDGKGGGYKAGVNNNNRLLVESVTSTIEHHVNHIHGEAYHVSFTQAPTVSGDCIFYMNNLNNEDLTIEGFVVDVSSGCVLTMYLGDKGTRNNATTIVPVNVHAGIGNTANGTFERGADLGGGAATLTGGSQIFRFKSISESDSKYINFEQDVVLNKNETFTVYCSKTGVTVNMCIYINFHTGDIV